MVVFFGRGGSGKLGGGEASWGVTRGGEGGFGFFFFKFGMTLFGTEMGGGSGRGYIHTASSIVRVRYI